MERILAQRSYQHWLGKERSHSCTYITPATRRNEVSSRVFSSTTTRTFSKYVHLTFEWCTEAGNKIYFDEQYDKRNFEYTKRVWNVHIVIENSNFPFYKFN